MTDKAFIIHPVLPPSKGAKGRMASSRALDDVLEEAKGLVNAIHLRVLGIQTLNIPRINPATLIGKGAVESLSTRIADLGPTVIIINANLSPVQQRNLEKAFSCKVIDRTGLILEIFGERAQTKEGKIQVDLAILEYQKSRLVRSWTHLERQRGGGGFMGGPGETQIELDRRMITDKIVQLKKELQHVRRTRDLGRQNRQKVPFPVIALVGYTNAGKSSLFNRLTGANVYAENLPFATLDPTMRRLILPSGKAVILSDTVGFIADLPTTLVEAFRATLEQVVYADIILHVRDVSSPDHPWQHQDVIDVLFDLGIDYPQDQRIFEIYNKIDAIADPSVLEEVRRTAAFAPVPSFCVSALTGDGITPLLQALNDHISKNETIFVYRMPMTDGKALSWLHRNGEVLEQGNPDATQNTLVHVRLSHDNKGRFESRFGYSCQS